MYLESSERDEPAAKHGLSRRPEGRMSIRWRRSLLELASCPCPTLVALTACEQEIAGQSLRIAKVGRIRKAYVDRSGVKAVRSVSIDADNWSFVLKEPHQNRRWGGRRDRRAGSAPVNIKERVGRS